MSTNGQRVVDLDLLRKEARKEPILIRIAGEEFSAPGELPYPAFRALGRLAGLDTKDPAATGQMLDGLDIGMAALIGPETWARFSPELSMDDALALLQGILVTYGLADPDLKPEEALGESSASSG